MTKKQEIKLQSNLTLAHQDYDKMLYAFAFFRVHDNAISQDLVQDTFMKTWAYLLKGGEILNMKAFLYRVLKNLIVDEYRKKKVTSLDELLDKGFQPSGGDSHRLGNILDAKAVLLYISLLRKPYDQIMHMRFMEDLSLQEISAITGQSKNVISVQLNRGIKLLKPIYSP